VVLNPFLLSFGIIFVAELGDKSQLMAMTFATRFRFWTVLLGITIATAVVHLLSVAIGVLLGQTLPFGWINLLAGLAFIGFGFWTLRGDELTDEDNSRAARSNRSALFVVGGAFFLAELGDKTMLATVTLATNNEWFGTWLGSTLGMVAADAMAIGLGALLGRALPEKVVRIGAAVLFFAFGALLVAEGLRSGL
jgi:Ca2+/H+ antiporter, TMEM165/GDT1 family